jgi:hypothetical protein
LILHQEEEELLDSSSRSDHQEVKFGIFLPFTSTSLAAPSPDII